MWIKVASVGGRFRQAWLCNESTISAAKIAQIAIDQRANVALNRLAGGLHFRQWDMAPSEFLCETMSDLVAGSEPICTKKRPQRIAREPSLGPPKAGDTRAGLPEIAIAEGCTVMPGDVSRLTRLCDLLAGGKLSFQLILHRP